jgi:cold shock CspA family protein
MASGAVKWFDVKKGYGFITPDLGPRDVFVHVSALNAAGLARLVPGQRVDFELAQDGDGRLIALGIAARDLGPDAEDPLAKSESSGPGE